MNLPNKLTVARLVLAVVLFGLLWGMSVTEGTDTAAWLGTAAFILFVVAAITDTLDGWIARRYRMITPFGCVADPLVDKIIICGCLVFLQGLESLRSIIAPWMIVVILFREFVVTGLRGFAESKGVDFMSIVLGKIKMITQCVTVAAAILYAGRLSHVAWARALVIALIWASVAITIGSGILYFPKARRLMAQEKGL